MTVGAVLEYQVSGVWPRGEAVGSRWAHPLDQVVFLPPGEGLVRAQPWWDPLKCPRWDPLKPGQKPLCPGLRPLLAGSANVQSCTKGLVGSRRAQGAATQCGSNSQAGQLVLQVQEAGPPLTVGASWDLETRGKKFQLPGAGGSLRPGGTQFRALLSIVD